MPKKAKSKWSKSQLKKLRDSLPTDWSVTLAEKHKLTTGTIENIIYGSQVNDTVVLSAIELALSYKDLIESKMEAIASL